MSSCGEKLTERSKKFTTDFTRQLNSRRELTESEGAAMEAEVVRRCAASREELNDGLERTR